jgi:CubicO group peptidase (beta-lactamase class C family)
MKEVLDNLVSTYHAGLVKGEHSEIHGYGEVSEGNPEPPDGNTLFDIGSITKTFTTTLLSVLVEEGQLSLGDQVRRLVPALSGFPPEMTLLQLATHTSGLPKMPSDIFRSMLRNRSNPYATYTTDDLLAHLSKQRPKPSRITTVKPKMYSNLGLALLGHILARKLGEPYEQAVVSRICTPLGMLDTRITLTQEQNERLSTPHSSNGKLVPAWDLPAFAGAGALRSTANDMLKFLRANLGINPSTLTEALEICQGVQMKASPSQGLAQRMFQRGGDTGQYIQEMALAWNVGRLCAVGRPVYWHHGATGGYQAFTGFVKSSATGVVVLANRGPGGMDLLLNRTSTDEIGFRVLEVLNTSE